MPWQARAVVKTNDTVNAAVTLGWFGMLPRIAIADTKGTGVDLMP